MFNKLTYNLFDLKFKYFNDDKKPNNDVVLIYIDEQTISNFGTWPLPRTVYIPVIDLLYSLSDQNIKPDSIFFDIFFSEKSPKNYPLINLKKNINIYKENIINDFLIKFDEEFKKSEFDELFSKIFLKYDKLYNNIL